MGWGGGANQDLLGPAITEAITPIMPLEQEWDAQKLEKRLRGYFRNAAKGLEFGSKPWDMLIDEYADRAWAAIFQALHDREWLQQADFLLVVDAGVKELFPRYVLQGVPQQAFERAVLNANDRAFEEQRFLPMLWETITQFVEGPKLKKKAYDAFDVGRKRAALNASAATDAGTPLEAFTEAWIAATVGRLATDNSGDPAAALPQDACTQMFQSLISQGALPLPLVTEHGSPPEGWPFIDEAVGRAYEQAAALASADPAERKAALAKGGVKGLLSGARTRGNYGLAGAGKGANGGGAATAWGRSSDVYGQPLGGGWGGGAIRPAGAGGGIWGAGAAAGAQWNSGAGAYGGGGGGYPAKRQRVGTATYDKPAAAPAGGGGKGKKTKGNPTCTQQEDCIGTPSTPLFQHVDGETPGDIYCASCWAVFADADPSLQAIPYQG